MDSVKFDVSGPEVLAVIGAVVIILAGVAFWLRLRRRQELANTARWLGLTFSGGRDAELTDTLAGMNLFAGSRGERAVNVVSGKYQNIEWKIGDYSYTVGHGKNSHVHCQTMALTRLAGTVPNFTLGAERFSQRLAEMLGYKDIDFPAAPVFSRRYVLRGADEAAVRRLFAPEVLRFFEQRNRVIHVAVRRGYLTIYYPDRRISADEMRAFLEMAAELAQRLTKALPAAAPGGTA